MSAIVGSLAMLGTAAALAGSYYLVSGIAYADAKNAEDQMKKDKKESSYFTLAREGEYKSVMRGGMNVGYIMAYKGHTLGRKPGVPDRGDDYDDKYVIAAPAPNPELEQQIQAWDWLQGIELVGILPGTSLYFYNFAWTSFKPGEMSDKTNPFKPHDERLIDYIYVMPAIYGHHIKEVELASDSPDSVGIHHDIWIVVTIQVTNPGRALHRIPSWLDATFSKLTPRLRTLFGGMRPEQINSGSIRTSGTEAAKDILTQNMIRICQEVTNGYTEPETGKYVEGTEFAYGSVIIDAAVYSIDPSDPKYRELLTANVRAEMEGEAAVTTAKLEGQAVLERATKEAEAIEKLKKASKGMTKRQYEVLTVEKWAEAMKAVAAGGKGIFNVGTPSVLSNLQSADLLREERPREKSKDKP